MRLKNRSCLPEGNMEMARRPSLTIVKNETGDQPDFILKMKAKGKKNRARSTIGAAWVNSAGGINIRLDPGVTLTYRDMEDFHLTLWPAEDEEDAA